MEIKREEQISRMRELASILDEAAKVYYQEDREIMSNLEYDALYDELLMLEEDTGIVLSGSPTISVGYEALVELPKERHKYPMLSMDKTKEFAALKSFLGNQNAILSWKLDGLTIVLTYRGGELAKAVTRGNGEVGEIITNNARVMSNIPLKIDYKGELILRGEAVISYTNFKRINEEIEDVAVKYKNPRNLCSGSVRQLNNEVAAKRKVEFHAFALVEANGVSFENSRRRQFEWLKDLGFSCVEYQMVDKDNLKESVEQFSHRIADNDLPSDGLVLIYDDLEYSRSLGATAKFPRDSMAFKWEDEMQQTTLLAIEWSPSRTGLINPVAIFEPVELEGTTVSRASVHNVSILKSLELKAGDTIVVYKANMIIPQIAENLTKSGIDPLPESCPACGGHTKVENANDIETIHCTNLDCAAKKIKSFTLFVSRNAMNIEGMSEATLEKFIAKGFIHEYADLFHLDRYRDEIVEMEGFGEKSYKNLVDNADKARRTTLDRVIYSLGIPNIGAANAKMICKEFHYDLDQIRQATLEQLNAIDGVGGVIAEVFYLYFRDEGHRDRLDRLLKELTLDKPEFSQSAQIFQGQNFVITGNLGHFPNRNAIKELIESKGGKVTGSVTSKTSYLINNDNTSNSSKNKKARDLAIPVITEEEFLKLVSGQDNA